MNTPPTRGSFSGSRSSSFSTGSGGGHTAGTRLGRYELVSRLATGGMAEIFLAIERGVKGLERLVVIKRILPHLAAHDAFVEMFLQEARIVARLSHPNIVQIYELGEEQGAYFIAMEYVPGSSIRELMRTAAKSDVKVPVGVALGLMIQACAGTHAAHELTDPTGHPLGLVHRDISPHNLMVTTPGHVKLLDFGIAKATELALDEKTRTGALKGKVHYMSPEQCKQEPLDRRSDVFALGIVLWELLTARRLFKRESELETMQAIVAGETWDPREFRDDIPEPVVIATMRALQANKDERYKTADEMRRALLDAADIVRISAQVDDVSPFVTEVLGDAHRKVEEQVQEAVERTMAGMLETEDATVLDRPPALADRDGGTGSGTTHGGGETLPPTPRPARSVPGMLQAAEGRRFGVPAVFALVAALVAVLAGTGLYLWRHTGPSVSGAPVVMGWAPTFDKALLRQELEPLRIYFEEQTGRPIQFVLADSYADLSQRLLEAKVDFAVLPPYIFLETMEKNPGLHPLAVNLLDGASGNDGVLLVAERTGVSSIQELKGLTWCYPDENSTTGYQLPRAAMIRGGIDPDKDLKQRKSANHLQLLRDLNDGLCDVAGTYSGNYTAASAAGVNVSPMRQIAITGRSPNDAVVASERVPDALRDQMKRALLTFDAEKALGRRAVGELAKISGFTEAKMSDWEDVKRSLAATGPLDRALAPPDSPPPPGIEPAPAEDGRDEPRKKARGKRRRGR